jgi:heat shock protein HtpX
LDTISRFVAPYIIVVLASSGMSALGFIGLRFADVRAYRLRAWITLAPLVWSFLLALQISPSCFAHWLSMSSWDPVHLICSDPDYLYIRSICTSWVALISASFFVAGALGTSGYILGGWIVRTVYGYQKLGEEDLGDIYRDITKISDSAGIGTPDLYLIESSRPLIFSHGGHGGPCVFISVGLLEILSRDELLASFSHEVAHIMNSDTLWSSFTSSLRIASMFNPVGVLLEPILARDREFLADEEGAMLSGRPRALVSALVKLSQVTEGGVDELLLGGLSLSLFMPGKIRWKLLSRHPSLEERVWRILELEERGPAAHQ